MQGTASALTDTVRRVMEAEGFEVELQPVVHEYLSSCADMIAALGGCGRVVVETKELQPGMRTTPDMLQQVEYMVRLLAKTVEGPVRGLLVSTGAPSAAALHYLANHATGIRFATGDEADVALKVRELAAELRPAVTHKA